SCLLLISFFSLFSSKIPFQLSATFLFLGSYPFSNLSITKRPLNSISGILERSYSFSSSLLFATVSLSSKELFSTSKRSTLDSNISLSCIIFLLCSFIESYFSDVLFKYAYYFRFSFSNLLCILSLFSHSFYFYVL